MRTLIVVVTCLCVISLSGSPGVSAQDLNRQRTPVTNEEVGQAITKELKARLPQEPPSPTWDFDVPVAVPAASPHQLRVLSMCRDADSKLLRVQLGCGKPGACLPFLVYVRIAEPVPVGSCGNDAPTQRLPVPLPVVHAGDRANAMLSFPGLQLSAPVVCLDSGVPGEIIHVRAREGRVFRARVTGPISVEVLLP